MDRERISATVDGDLLAAVRERRPGVDDSSLLEEALGALLSEPRRSEIDASYREAYDRVPFDAADAWGDLVSFGTAADAS